MKNNLKALLLSAGFGTRLRPITNKIPKCLVEINKKSGLAPCQKAWKARFLNGKCDNSTLTNSFDGDI